MSAATTTIGLVGVGAWGGTLLDRFASLGVEVVCYPGRTEASRGRLHAHGDHRAVGSVDALLSEPAIDAIAIATPPETHSALAQQALSAGKHVFVEKPLCLEMDDLRRILSLARERSRVLFTGYTVSFHPVVRELARLSTEGRLRTIWSHKAKTGSFASDVVSTLLVHDLAVVDILTGGLDAWVIDGVSGPERDPDAVNLAFGSASGARGRIRVDRVSPDSRRELGVWIDDRVFRWAGGHDLLEFVDGDFPTVYSSPLSALEAELQGFLAAVADGRREPEAVERERRLAELTIRVREEALA